MKLKLPIGKRVAVIALALGGGFALGLVCAWPVLLIIAMHVDADHIASQGVFLLMLIPFAMTPAVFVYFAPWLLARKLEHPHQRWMFRLNFAIGWFPFVWMICMGFMLADWFRSRLPICLHCKSLLTNAVAFCGKCGTARGPAPPIMLKEAV